LFEEIDADHEAVTVAALVDVATPFQPCMVYPLAVSVTIGVESHATLLELRPVQDIPVVLTEVQKTTQSPTWVGVMLIEPTPTP
jgi:hypothetical protein